MCSVNSAVALASSTSVSYLGLEGPLKTLEIPWNSLGCGMGGVIMQHTCIRCVIFISTSFTLCFGHLEQKKKGQTDGGMEGETLEEDIPGGYCFIGETTELTS